MVLSNFALSAVHFEKAEYDLVIEVCKKAVEVGRDNRSDYKHVAK